MVFHNEMFGHRKQQNKEKKICKSIRWKVFFFFFLQGQLKTKSVKNTSDSENAEL